MWNFLDIKCPSNDLCELSHQDNSILENLRDFVTFLTTAADTLTSDHPLWVEIKVLQNIQAKYKRILRCDKCLLHLHRVGQCLKKMVLLNLSRSYLDLAERFLVGLQDSSTTMILPSKQQIEYILIRTQSAAKLVCDTIRYSRETFCFLIQKLKVGHLLLDLVVAASVTARINVMVKAILVELCDMYKKVLPWRSKLKEGSFQWPEDINLPEDLEKWVQESESGLLKPFLMSKSDANFLSSFLKSKNGNKESDSDSIIIVNDNVDEDCSIIDNGDRVNDTDYGEVISRKAYARQSSELATFQMQLLQRIMNVCTYKKLENIWIEITSTYQKSLPNKLTGKRERIINNLLARLKKRIENAKSSCKKHIKKKIVSNFVRIFAIRLGFTEDQMKFHQKDSDVLNASQPSNAKLKPVKTLKELRILFKQLCNVLVSSNESDKSKMLKKIFKQRMADIKLLKQSGEKATARKLIFCTSKVFLTLCTKR